MNYKKDDFPFLVMYLEKISAFAPLPIRIMAGIAFIIHGLPKFENLQGTQGFFASVGIPADLALTNRTTRSNRRCIIDSWTTYKNNLDSFCHRNDWCYPHRQSR